MSGGRAGPGGCSDHPGHAAYPWPVTRRWIVLTALSVVAFLALSLTVSAVTARPVHRPIQQSGPLVIVAMPTLTWKDVSPRATPTVWSLAQQGAVGNMVTRAISAHSCSAHAWLTMSAGARATLGKGPGETPRGGTPQPCASIPHAVSTGQGAIFPSWSKWRKDSLARPIAANIGLLATTLRAHGQCVSAVGPGAALGAADETGLVARYYPTPETADLTVCPVTLVGLPGPDDAALGSLLTRLPPETTIVVTGLADDATPEQLRAVLVAGPGVEHGLLRSASTRQPGLLQTADLTALALARTSVGSAPLPDGRSPSITPTTDMTGAIEYARNVSDALLVEHRAVAPFFVTYVALLLAATVFGLALLVTGRRRDKRRATLGRRWFLVLGAVAGSVPVATFLVGLIHWWTTSRPGTAMALWTIAIAAALGAIALLGPWRHWVAGPATVIAATTAVVIALDATHGSPLQFISTMGLQPVYGGRYYGMGNVGYALLASTSLLSAALLAGRWIRRGHPRLAAATVIVIGAATLLVDGYPSWGADAGGPLALLPAFAYLALNAAGLAVTWKRILGVGGLTVLVVGGLGLLDYLRPPKYRTHLGDFVASVIETGKLTSLQRNVTANVHMLTSHWFNLFVPVLLALTLYALIRRDSRLGRPVASITRRVPFLGHGLAAITICWLLGFLSNDSGTAIPPSGMVVIIPLVILTAASSGRPAPADVRVRPKA